MSGYQAALSYLLLHSIEGEFPDICINYSSLRFSKGNLAIAKNAKLECGSDTVMVNWSYTQSLYKAFIDDEVNLLVFNQEKEMFLLSRNGPRRENGQTSMIIPKEFRQDTLHCYLFFISRNGRESSNSQYLGVYNHPSN